jgi:hypothetical protein
VDRSFSNDLRDLARDAPSELPNLKSVQVNCMEDMLDDVLSERTRVALQDAFDGAGISLSWGTSWHGEEVLDIPGLPMSISNCTGSPT